jgi:hypothetical protein
MGFRDIEAELISRCLDIAQDRASTARDQREANVFRLASMVLQSRHSVESLRLMQVSNQYFAAHPNEQLHASEVVRQGWIMNLPRLRDRLSRRLVPD